MQEAQAAERHAGLEKAHAALQVEGGSASRLAQLQAAEQDELEARLAEHASENARLHDAFAEVAPLTP